MPFSRDMDGFTCENSCGMKGEERMRWKIIVIHKWRDDPGIEMVNHLRSYKKNRKGNKIKKKKKRKRKGQPRHQRTTVWTLGLYGL